jgi:hypothetical protein
MKPRWRRRFDDPIPLPRGGSLNTLADAAIYLLKLPKKKRDSNAWRMAGNMLLDAAHGRDFVMHARIAVARAITADNPPPPSEPRRRPVKKYRLIR